MNKIVIHLIAAARPNFMKVAPLYHSLRAEVWCRPMIVHTGQHYDANMSDAFFRDLRLPAPDRHLGVGSGTHAEQTAGVMVAYERLCMAEPPDGVVVVGDVNSTLACTLAAKKLCLPVMHLEAGLRSFDRTMPEEINRVVTDSLADLLWTPSPDADENLAREGIAPARIVRVGNIMIDAFEMLRSQIAATDLPSRMALIPGTYGVVTIHRPSNVDAAPVLGRIIEALRDVALRLPLAIPIHPRTRARLLDFGLMSQLENHPDIRLLPPLGYVDFMSLLMSAALVITDSGGIQEETTYLGVPCLTLRDTTERPVTVTEGTNHLTKIERLGLEVEGALSRARTVPKIAQWDGNTAARVVASLKKFFEERPVR